MEYLEALQSIFSFIISNLAAFVNNLFTGSLTALLIPMLLGVGVSITWVLVRTVRKIMWGN